MTIPWPGGKRLPHAKQLQSGSPTASTDCGPASLVMALQVASGPSIRVPRDLLADWISTLRQHMTRYGFWPATSLPNHEQAADSDTVRGAFLGVALFRPTAWDATLTHGDILDLLREGCGIVLGVDYGWLNDNLPRLSGSPTFRGGHFVALQGLEDGHTRLGDPLHDGRRAGIPKGWQTVRARRYLEAGQTFGGAGKGRAKVLAIRPAKERT